MTLSKRIFDIALALLAVGLLAIPGALIAVVLLVCQGRPILYASERMKTPNEAFHLWKFRTMHLCRADAGVSGGDKISRITPLGRFLRRYRLDELPQLWNILRGDISFVGPRPPLKNYVERFPHLYRRVLASRPGLTGLATLVFRAREERLLAACTTSEETDAVYSRRCIPQKARLDLIYQAKQSMWLDAVLLARTGIGLTKRQKSHLPTVHHSRRKLVAQTASSLS
jgi:lipopolysaccharide/colanic/teichoic acid biosynthesis glycosyltransferase